MQRVAKFEKVSFEEFKHSWESAFGDCYEAKIKMIYDKIKLPKRATAHSAGYDFFLPMEISLLPNESIKIPTGVRAKINEGWVLKIYPRSSLGFKYRLQLNNTVGIIDGDYYNSDNEGHIQIKLTNRTTEHKTLTIGEGQGFCQGIFVEYGITVDDEVSAIRNGGFGSTNK